MLAVIAALVADFWSIEEGTFRTQSTVKRSVLNTLLGRPLPPPPSTPPPPPVVFWQRGDELAVRWRLDTIRRPPQYVSVPSVAIDDTWELVGSMYGPYTSISGYYHPNRRRTAFRISTYTGGPSEADLMSLYVEAFDALPHAPGTPRDDPAFTRTRFLCAAGVNEDSEPLPAGYLRNALTLTLLALLLTLPIAGRTDLWLAPLFKRIFRRRKPWQCQTCGYDITGLTTCPECGATRKTPASNE